MGNTNTKPFRFLDLPPELRNKAYELALCSFEDPGKKCPEHAKLVIHNGVSYSAILRTSRDVYGEAYNVMVKKNRLVHVKATAGISLDFIFRSYSVPWVTNDEQRIAQFPGLVLRVTLYTDRALLPRAEVDAQHQWRNIQGSSIMMLGRHLLMLCRALTEMGYYIPYFSRLVSLQIKLAPAFGVIFFDRRNIVKEVYSMRIQESLLDCFHEVLREFPNVSVQGKLKRLLVDTIVRNASKPRWTDPNKVRDMLEHAHDRTLSAIVRGRVLETCKRSAHVGFLVTQVRESMSWEVLVLRGGEDFIAELAGLKFSCNYRAGNFALQAYHSLDKKTGRLANTISQYLQAAHSALDLAEHCMHIGAWQQGQSWAPEDTVNALFHMAFARCYMVSGNPRYVDNAVAYINAAAVLDPNNTVIQEQKEKIQEWADAMQQ